MRENATSSPADFSAFLNHADAGVRERAWVWQSALGLLALEGLEPSPYLVETARRHMDGTIPLALACKLVEASGLTRSGEAAKAADRKCLELVCMLAGQQEPPAAPATRPEPVAAAEPAPETPAAPATAAGLHLRQKRLLRTLGADTLSVPELLQALRLSTRQSFMRIWLSPAMDMGLVKALHQHAPHHPQQKYLLTRKGQRFLKQLIRK